MEDHRTGRCILGVRKIYLLVLKLRKITFMLKTTRENIYFFNFNFFYLQRSGLIIFSPILFNCHVTLPKRMSDALITKPSLLIKKSGQHIFSEKNNPK